MNCAKVRELISAYADGLVSPRVREELSEHIAVCESCAREVETTTRMLAAVSELGNSKAPVDLWPVVQVRIDGLAGPRRRGLLERIVTPVLRPVVALPVAAAALAGVAMFVHMEHGPSDSGKSSEMAAYVQEYSEFQSRQSFGDRSYLIAAQLDRPVGEDK